MMMKPLGFEGKGNGRFIAIENHPFFMIEGDA